MDPRRDDSDLAVELRALRPAPSPEFATKLDERAAAGFPRGESGPAAALRRLAERLRATPPRRVLAPAGACALAAIVVATTVVAISEDQPEDPRTLLSGETRTTTDQPLNGQPENRLRSEHFSGAASSQPSPGAAAGVESSGEMLQPPGVDRIGSPAANERHREIERAARIVLGTDPASVRSDAAKVFDAVHAADGIVLRSSIRDGSGGEAGAEFELLIPSGKLGDALADFSAIGEVRSRRESTQDITAPTIGARERLQDSRAKIEGLLNQLARAETEAERVAAEAKLRAERRQAAFLDSQLDSLNRRANLSRVSLRIETGSRGAGEDEGGAWGAGDGLDDAGRILEIAAGVTIVGLAIVGPLALIALLAWLAHRAWVRRRRSQVLSQTE